MELRAASARFTHSAPGGAGSASAGTAGFLALLPRRSEGQLRRDHHRFRAVKAQTNKLEKLLALAERYLQLDVLKEINRRK